MCRPHGTNRRRSFISTAEAEARLRTPTMVAWPAATMIIAPAEYYIISADAATSRQHYIISTRRHHLNLASLMVAVHRLPRHQLQLRHFASPASVALCMKLMMVASRDFHIVAARLVSNNYDARNIAILHTLSRLRFSHLGILIKRFLLLCYSINRLSLKKSSILAILALMT